MTELEIPTAAIYACALAIDPDEDLTALTTEDINDIQNALAAAVPSIVAAELRRLADVFISAESRDEAAVLLGRADELAA